MSTHSLLDSSHCPLCQQPNQCAISAGLPPQSCWCMQASISSEALNRIPPQARGKACICPACSQPTEHDSSTA